MKPVVEKLDRLRRGEDGSRAAWKVLAVAMPLAAALALWFGRHTFFSVDELAWISASPDLNLGGALEPHVGHLVLIPKLLYKLAFETIGSEYVTFRLLTTASVLLTATLFFVWARRRIPDFIALAGTLVVLFFPADALHFIAGNGFTIMFALACGLAALIAWDRGDRPGDIAAFGFLLLGTATYTVALPFAVGLVAAALLERSGRSRIWVGLVPLALYLLWRILVGAAGTDPEAGGADWANLVLVPSWTFQGLGTVLAAWSGLNFDFSSGGSLPPGAGPGPVLALVALVALGWRISRGDTRPWFWVTVIIALALYASQTLGWGAILRGPEMPRYLYPGLIVVLLIAVEAARGMRWSRTGFAVLWLITAVSLLTSYGLLQETSETYKLRGQQMRAEITAVTLLDSTGVAPVAADQSRRKLSEEFEPGPAAAYGFLGIEPSTLGRRKERIGDSVDRFLSGSLLLELSPLTAPVALGRCRAAVEQDEDFRLSLPADGAVLTTSTTAKLSLGRFGAGVIGLATVGPGSSQLLQLYPDSDPTPWFVTSDQPGLVGCAVAERSG